MAGLDRSIGRARARCSEPAALPGSPGPGSGSLSLGRRGGFGLGGLRSGPRWLRRRAPAPARLGCCFGHGAGGPGFGVALLDRAANPLAAARSAAAAAVAIAATTLARIGRRRRFRRGGGLALDDRVASAA